MRIIDHHAWDHEPCVLCGGKGKAVDPLTGREWALCGRKVTVRAGGARCDGCGRAVELDDGLWVYVETPQPRVGSACETHGLPLRYVGELGWPMLACNACLEPDYGPEDEEEGDDAVSPQLGSGGPVGHPVVMRGWTAGDVAEGDALLEDM